MDFIINLILGLLAFFVARYIANMVLPDGADKDKIAIIVGLLAGIIIYFANFAVQIHK